MKPFVKLLSSRFPETYELGLFALANLSDNGLLRFPDSYNSSAANRSIMIDEELDDIVLAHSRWPRLRNPRILALGNDIVAHFGGLGLSSLRVLAQVATLPPLESEIRV